MVWRKGVFWHLLYFVCAMPENDEATYNGKIRRCSTFTEVNFCCMLSISVQRSAVNNGHCFEALRIVCLQSMLGIFYTIFDLDGICTDMTVTTNITTLKQWPL